MEMYNYFLLYPTFFVGIIPILLYPFRRPNFDSKAILPFIVLLAFSCFYEVFASLILKWDTKFWFRIYPLLEMICLYYFFNRLSNQKYRYLYASFLILYSGTFVASFFILKGRSWYVADSYMSIIEILFVFTAIFLWFKNLFTEMAVDSLLKIPAFYFISGFIIYFSGTFFLFLMTDDLISHKGMGFFNYWMINVIMSFILRILLILGVWKARVK